MRDLSEEILANGIYGHCFRIDVDLLNQMQKQKEIGRSG